MAAVAHGSGSEQSALLPAVAQTDAVRATAGPQALRNEYLANLVRNQTPPLRAAYLAGLINSVQL